MAEPVWDGAWVADELGVRLAGDGLRDLVGLALRRNPKRAHLLVSHVLGKHVPVAPARLFAAATELGARVRAAAGGPYAVLGYAETATGLGHAVAAALGSDAYLHSTRRPVAGVEPYGAFEEEHSHATSHLLLPDRPAPLDAPTLVLVDDELSTGRTVRNTIAGLRRTVRHERYLAAALVDVTGDSARRSVALAAGTVELPADLVARAAEVIERAARPPVAAAPRGKVVALEPVWPAAARESGRHGFGRADERRARDAAAGVARRLAGEPLGDRVLVLGTEELMHAPALVADALADLAPGTVHVSSTTRSPVAVIDSPGYPIRTALRFPASDGYAAGEPRFAYNVAPPPGGEPYSDVVLVVDAAADTPALWTAGGLVEHLAGVTERVFVVTLPTRGPAAP